MRWMYDKSPGVPLCFSNCVRELCFRSIKRENPGICGKFSMYVILMNLGTIQMSQSYQICWLCCAPHKDLFFCNYVQWYYLDSSDKSRCCSRIYLFYTLHLSECHCIQTKTVVKMWNKRIRNKKTVDIFSWSISWEWFLKFSISTRRWITITDISVM